MDLDRVFWVWFTVTVLFSIIMLFSGISLLSLFGLQILLLIGFLIEKLSGRATMETVRKTRKDIYDFWLRTSELEPEIRVKKGLLDRFR